MKVTVLTIGFDSYEERDVDILRARYHVDVVRFPPYGAYRNIVPMLGHIAGSDLIYAWFADYPAVLAFLLAKLLRRKTMVNIMGYEAARVPEIGYGRSLRLDGKYFARWAINLADKVFAVSNCTRGEAIRHLAVRDSKVTTLHHGFEVPPIGGQGKERMALTVGRVRWDYLKRKGLETFVKSAAYLRDVPFVVLGDWQDDAVDYLKAIASPNVHFEQVGARGRQCIEEHYKRAKVYVQASLHEGFGCSVAEAMLFECVPVVTECGALPEVVGDSGFYVPPRDPEGLAAKIALALSSEKGCIARKRVMDNFPFDKRKTLLLEAADGLLRED